MFRFLILLIFLNLVKIQAQNQKMFPDTFGLKGIAIYDGDWQDSILPRKGNFEFSCRELTDRMLNTYLIKGRLKAHMPEGHWIWEQAAWDYSIEAGKTIVPLFHLKGERKMWTAEFLNGKAHGNWMFSIDSILNGKRSNQNFVNIRGRFNNGQLTEQLLINDFRPGTYFSLSGQTDKYGIAAGKWTIKYFDRIKNETLTEERHYRNGVLTNVNKIKDGVEYFRLSFNNVIEQLVQLDTANSFLPFKIGNIDFDTDGFESVGKERMVHYLDYFLNKGWVLPEFNYQFERNGPIFRRIQYPFNSPESVFIHKSDSLTQLLKPEIEKRLNYRNIFINRGRNSQLDLALAYSQAGSYKLKVIDSLLHVAALPLFTYINRFDSEELKWEPLINLNSDVKGEIYDSVMETLPQIRIKKHGENIFENIYHLLTQLESELPQYFSVIDKSYFTLQKESELQLLEDEITEKLRRLDSLYSELKGTGEIIRINKVDYYLRKQIQLLAQTNELDNSYRLATLIISRIDTLINLRTVWPLIDSMEYRLNEQYTYHAYNPYTGNHDIELRIKKRFYIKVTQVLIPWLNEELKQKDNWDNWLEHIRLYRETFQHLMDFALIDEKSSKRIEKRIRKEKSPHRMQKILSDYMKN